MRKKYLPAMNLHQIKAKALSFFAEKGIESALFDDLGWCAERTAITLRTLGLKTHVIGEDFEPDLSVTFLGRRLSFPVMPAPLSGAVRMIKAEWCREVALTSQKMGTVPWIGYPVERSEVAELKDFVWILKPLKNRRMIYAEIEFAEERCLAVGIDLDCFAYEMIGGNLYPYEFLKRISYDELRDLVSSTKLPFIAKGILSEEDYRLAVKAGCDAVVISNRGGKILESAVSSVEVLQRIEKEVETGIDGFIRSGEDVLKLLAIGADFVLVGRPVIWGLAVPDGVEAVLEFFRNDLKRAMLACGVKNIESLSSDILIQL